MNFQALVASFPAARRLKLAEVWDAERALGLLCSGGLSHGEALVLRFLLGVWNTCADWEFEAGQSQLLFPTAAKRFDLIEAAGVWDGAHLGALAAWLKAPVFP